MVNGNYTPKVNTSTNGVIGNFLNFLKPFKPNTVKLQIPNKALQCTVCAFFDDIQSTFRSVKWVYAKAIILVVYIVLLKIHAMGASIVR